MSAVDMSPKAVSARLAAVAAKSDLKTARRLDTKVDLSPAAVSRRIEQVSKLRAFCLSMKAK